MIMKVYCAFCRLQRKVYSKRHVNWTNVSWSLIASLILMAVLWGEFEPKFLVFFAIAVSFAEIFVHVRWRMSLPCTHCGFDPMLYKVDREKAAQKVKDTLTELKKSGKFMLRQNNPFENLPTIKRDDIKHELNPSGDSHLQRTR